MLDNVRGMSFALPKRRTQAINVWLLYKTKRSDVFPAKTEPWSQITGPDQYPYPWQKNSLLSVGLGA